MQDNEQMWSIYKELYKCTSDYIESKGKLTDIYKTLEEYGHTVEEKYNPNIKIRKLNTKNIMNIKIYDDNILNNIVSNMLVKTTDLSNILKYPQIFWDYLYFSQFGQITILDILSYPGLRWNYYGLSSNEHITIEEIFEASSLPWDYQKSLF